MITLVGGMVGVIVVDGGAGVTVLDGRAVVTIVDGIAVVTVLGGLAVVTTVDGIAVVTMVDGIAVVVVEVVVLMVDMSAELTACLISGNHMKSKKCQCRKNSKIKYQNRRKRYNRYP